MTKKSINMKRRILLTLGVLLTLTSALAQISTTPIKIPGSGVAWIPTEFTYRHEYQFFMGSDLHLDAGDEITFYDENINKIRTITLAAKPNVLDLTSPDNFSLDTDHLIVFTQTLFNNDPDYEYVVMLRKKNQDDEYDYYGFCVMNENGEQVTSVSFPKEADAGSYMYLMTMGDKRYLVVEADGGSYVYAIDANTSSINRIEEPLKSIVRPGIAKRSEPVTVTLEPSGSDRQILVTSANGTSYIHKNISAEAESVTIDTTSLPQGMYIVSIAENGKSTENCKIIIR